MQVRSRVFESILPLTMGATLALIVSLPRAGGAAEAFYSVGPQTPTLLNVGVASGSLERTGATVNLELMRDGQTGVLPITCILPQGIQSLGMKCSYLPILGTTAMTVHEEDGVMVFQASLAQLDAFLATIGFQIVGGSQDPTPPPQAYPAEAAWVNGHWECQLEQIDIDACKLFCGGDYDSLMVDESIPSNNLALEPSCDVDCTCKDGRESSRTDYPQ